MVLSNEPLVSHRRNVLTLDGGGVRGLSSLLILRDLMQQVNTSIKEESLPGEIHNDVRPHDVFDFVGGTSTGGLIAIMLGKLGMSLEDCIKKYHELSKTVFGKKHIRGRITHGLGTSRYSGTRLRNCVRDLLQSKGFSKEIEMASGRDTIACAVVCREHETSSKYSAIKSRPVCICSLPCHKPFACRVCDAARATSAAPTFFPVTDIGDRSFVDGGMEHNNPSQAIYYHYTEYDRVAGSRRVSVVEDVPSPITRHGSLDFSVVRLVNLGTGTKADALPRRQRDRLAKFVPGFIRMGIFLKKTLTEIAVNSENVAEQMRTISHVSRGGTSLNVKYERFSADNGVCYIKLDSHKELKQIEGLTVRYLEKEAIQKELKRVGKDIAADYLKRHRTNSHLAVSGARLVVPEHNLPRPNTSPSTGPIGSVSNTNTPVSTSSSSNYPESSIRNGPSRDPSTRSTDPNINSPLVAMTTEEEDFALKTSTTAQAEIIPSSNPAGIVPSTKTIPSTGIVSMVPSAEHTPVIPSNQNSPAVPPSEHVATSSDRAPIVASVKNAPISPLAGNNPTISSTESRADNPPFAEQTDAIPSTESKVVIPLLETNNLARPAESIIESTPTVATAAVPA